MIILSLDISSISTGWVVYNDLQKSFFYGKIKTKPKDPLPLRLCVFRNTLKEIIDCYKPDNVVIEDAFSGINVRTMKVLVKFAGVAEQLCYEFLDTTPYIISNNTVKAYFKVRDKAELFNFIISMFTFSLKWNFKEYNDITDSLAQLLCYVDEILNCCNFREEKEYGFRYKVKCHSDKYLPAV